jgi:hypothetical protein
MHALLGCNGRPMRHVTAPPGHERERDVAAGKQHASDRNQMHRTGHPMTWRMRPEWKLTGRHGPCHTAGRKRRRERGTRRLLPNPSCCLEIDLPTSATRAAPNTAAVCFAPRPSLMRNPPSESTFRLFDHRRSRSPPPARYLRHRPLSFPTQSRAFPSSPLGRPCRCWCGILRSIFRRFNVHPGRASTGSHQNCGHTSRRLPPWQPMVPAMDPLLPTTTPKSQNKGKEWMRMRARAESSPLKRCE